MRRIIGVAVLVALVGQFASPATSSEINGSFRSDDPRLGQPVSVPLQRVLIGSLLSALQKKTGVPIVVGDKDLAPGTEVVISCSDTPLCDLLDGVWALLSAKDSEYRWYRDGAPGAYRYTLYEPDAVKKRAARLNDLAFRAYENYVNTVCDLAQLRPDQRKRRREIFRKAAVDTNAHAIDVLFNDERRWLGYEMFAELVPRDRRLPVLLGQQVVDIPLSQASDHVRSLFEATWQRFNPRTRNPDGTVVGEPLPASIRIAAEAPRFQQIVPAVVMQLGQNDAVSLISTARVGVGLTELVRKRWMLPGDALTDPADESSVPELSPDLQMGGLRPRPIVAPGNAATGSQGVLPGGTGAAPEGSALSRLRLPVYSLATHIRQLALQAHTPLIAILPKWEPGNMDFRTDRTVKDYVTKLESADSPIMHKWRSSILLLSYPRWFYEDSAVPYKFVLEFLSSRDGILHLPALARLMSTASDAEFSALSGHYNVVKSAWYMRPVLALSKAHPDLLKPDGLSVDADTLRYLQQLPHYEVAPDIRSGSIERIRATETSVPRKDGSTAARIDVESYAGGRWSRLDHLFQIPQTIFPDKNTFE